MAWVPLIGSGFDALASQQQAWTGRNDAIDQANLSRLAQAQQTQNNYLASVAQMQRQDQERQAAQVAAARQQALEAQQAQAATAERAQQFGESTREFNVGADLQRQQIQAAKDARDIELDKQRDVIGKTADFIAPQLADAGGNVDTAIKALDDARKAVDVAASKQAANLPMDKVMYDPRQRAFIKNPRAVSDLTPADHDAVNSANQAIAGEVADFQAATEAVKTHQTNLQSLLSQAQQAGLLAGQRNGKWILSSPLHGGKVWGDDSAAAPPSNPVDDVTNSPNWTPTTGALAGQQWYRPNLTSTTPLPTSGAAPAWTPPATATVTTPPALAPKIMRNPQGRLVKVPPEKVADAAKLGYTLVQ